MNAAQPQNTNGSESSHTVGGQGRLSFYDGGSNGVLFVRDDRGAYVVASPLQVMAAARSAADALIDRSAPLLNAPKLVGDFLVGKLGGFGVEVFSVLFLDSQHRFMAYREMFVGTLNQTSVYPREVARLALELGAASVVLCHNHPSGVVQPSGADIALTRQLQQALALLDIRVLDHIIVGAGQTLSMAEQGLMPAA